MSRNSHRLPSGGRIDRSTPVRFSIDGAPMSGFHGDTLASALLANGVHLVGRSFKYHRPRGFLSAGVEEPNGLFTLGSGGRSEPNIAGTVTDLVEGLTARCQNGWPSVRFDLQSVNSLLAPLLTAGFYYKTFMGPTRGSWMFYERFIRRAAGLGRGTYQRDPDRYETRHAFSDVLVIGAGPAGMSAALAAGRAGARVVLVEQDCETGGALLLELPAGEAEAWRSQTRAELDALPNVQVLTRTTAFGLYDGNMVGLLERRDHCPTDTGHGEPRQVTLLMRARSIVFATGATERPVIFRNNDRPGVMLASAVRCYLNRYAVLCGKRVVVVTSNDSAYSTALDLQRSGADVIVADLRAAPAAALMDTARAAGIEVLPGSSVVDVLGRKAVRGIVLAPARRLACDLVCMSGGWTPAVHLTSHGGVKPAYRPDIDAYVPGALAVGQFCAGAVNGSFAQGEALEQGRTAGQRAAAASGHGEPVFGPQVAPPAAVQPAYFAHSALIDLRGKAFVDFQNDVTVDDLRIANQEGYSSIEHLKRYTTLGMGTDQGKTSNHGALSLLAQLRGVDIAVAGTTTFRPPFTPVAIGALAGRTIGTQFRPLRRSPLHDWHLAHGGEMLDAGPWRRAWWYHWAGESVETAYVEEMRLVRTAVGLSDISTLGKIDVQGPDAAQFLDRVYVNTFSTLAVGKARYGVMLTDDGAVLDDGTTTRLSESHYFLTTTTAQAAEVMSWLEFLLQTAWTDLKVHVTSVTDEWAGMVVAGPRARAALELAFPHRDLSDAALPFMGCSEFDVDGVPLRLLRLSFSGELSYEIYTPADYATSLWEHLLASAAPLGMRPYGLEALASLRIEKGHVAGLELDHRNTLDDLGLGRMAGKQKAFVGRELRQRPLLHAAGRWSLVGLECLEPGKRLRGGAILFAAADAIEGHGRGYITSVTWSTVLDRYIALALYEGGLEHAGDQIVCAYPLKNEIVHARIVSPVFVDPAGERLRA